MFVVGLTGGIGSGKSSVSEHFASLGIDIVDSDEIAREVVEPGTPALQQIRNKFGDSVMLSDGRLNRAALRQIVFDQPKERRWLESLTHPIIGQRTEDLLAAAGSAYVVFSSPLLLQSGQDILATRICVVDLPEALQLARAASRDGAKLEAIKKIIRTQLSREQRLSRADDIIDNAGTLEATLRQVDALHLRYLDLAKASR
ncbi:MAG: dephospho-CoA kinase [Cellvibrionaceae bacterium]|nr:dephospho-CoA kinase [Cellvibrionaceae bacterium]